MRGEMSTQHQWLIIFTKRCIILRQKAQFISTFGLQLGAPKWQGKFGISTSANYFWGRWHHTVRLRMSCKTEIKQISKNVCTQQNFRVKKLKSRHYSILDFPIAPTENCNITYCHIQLAQNKHVYNIFVSTYLSTANLLSFYHRKTVPTLEVLK